jgi:hypothetical protein
VDESFVTFFTFLHLNLMESNVNLEHEG